MFGFNTNITGDIQKYFDFTINKEPVVTLWDKGANNTLDLSGYITASTVNLNPLGFSSFGNMTNNLVIAAGTSIDNAIGGAGDDVFITNGASDFINGGEGNNVAIFQDPLSAYTVTQIGRDIKIATKGTSIISTLENIQTIKFGDQSIAVSSLFPAATSTNVKDISGNALLPVLGNITEAANLTVSRNISTMVLSTTAGLGSDYAPGYGYITASNLPAPIHDFIPFSVPATGTF